MSQQLTPDEVAAVIQVRKILKQLGFPKDVDITSICQAAGISRKTAYQKANKLMRSSSAGKQADSDEFANLQQEHEELKERFDFLCFENEGRKLAWEIHHIDELLAEKKSNMAKLKNKKL